MSHCKDPPPASLAAVPDSTPPTYSFVTANSNVELQIFAEASEYLVQSKDQSQAYSSAIATVRYVVTTSRDITLVSSSAPSPVDSSISFSIETSSVRFQIKSMNSMLTNFEISKVNMPKFHNTNFTLLLKDMPPVQLELLSSEGIKLHVWRHKTTTEQTPRQQMDSSKAQEIPQSDVVHLILLDSRYREVACFTSQSNSTEERVNSSHLGGTLVFMQKVDDVLQQQVVISLLGLIEAYHQLMRKSYKWNERTDKAFGAALLCQIM